MENYGPPVDKLLALGRPDLGDEPPDYVSYGIGAEHVPELIRLLRDTELISTEESEEVDDPRWYAHIHAWRALGQLRAREAIEPLLDVIDENEKAEDWSDWVIEDVPETLALIGVETLPAVVARLNQMKQHDRVSSSYATVLKALADRFPETRAEVVNQIAKLLGTAAANAPDANGFIIAELLDLKATEAWPAIERAFATGNVEESIAGGAGDVKYELGLGPKPPRDYPPPASPYPSGQNAKQRFNERQRQKKLAKKQEKKKRKGK